GSDGSKGIKYIKANGGLVIAQQLDQAKFTDMPQNAINTDLADFVLPVEEMFKEIKEFFASPDLMDATSEFSNVDHKSLTSILNLVQQQTDLDFKQYKNPTLLRRMSRRMKILQLTTIKDYFRYLEDNSDEIQNLYNDFLIGVTKFFRDEEAWDVLRKHVVPEIVKYSNPDEIIKVWDVGCNTGEETYSLAILFAEECKKQDRKVKLKIFATDISQESLDKASKGIYHTNNLAQMDNSYVASYFNKLEDGDYKISDRIRRMVLFTNHNIIKDPPFNNVDIVLCRNLLIYLQTPVQQRVLKVMHYSLKLEGYLMLGPSENLGSEHKFYEDVSRKWKIYKNIKTTYRSRDKFLFNNNAFNFDSEKPAKNIEEDQDKTNRTRLRRKAEESLSAAILEQFNATTIQIDGDYNVIEARGHFGRYAQFPKEGFTTDLLKMLPEGFTLPIKTAVNKAHKSKSRIIFEKIYLEKEGDKDSYFVDLMILPLIESNSGKDDNFIITIVDREASDINDVIKQDSSMDATAKTRIEDLEEELTEVQSRLNKSIEETETSNEELQASNEELLASNEELQSTNEELQSVNEELHTVNNEHLQKMDELASLNADMDNLLDSTEIGVLYLDKELRVRKFTPSVQDHFSFLKQDIGRHIDNFTLNFSEKREDSLIKTAMRVMETGKSVDKNVTSKDGRHFLKRITPFTGIDKEIDGVIIAFIDIEEIHISQKKVQESEKKFKDFYDADPVMHTSINANTGILVECNNKFVQRLGYKNKKEVLGKVIFDFYTEESKLEASKTLEKLRKDKEIKEVELTMVAKDGSYIPVLLNSNIKKSKDGVVLTRGSLIDISKKKEVEDKLRLRTKEVEKANIELEQFVSICSHDLQEPLSTIRFGSDFLMKKYSDQLTGKAAEYVSYIHDASGRLSNQIKALLEHSKLGQNVEKTEVDIQELIEVVKYDLSKRISQSGAEVNARKLPTVRGYKTELRLLFQNIISNSLKYRREGVPPIINISSYKDGRHYVFTVADNGMGISEDNLKKIFTIFNRGDAIHKESGTGVGLAHCLKIVKLHDGKIWADSQLGVGSTFHIKIRSLV
ncbi:MAG: CheR family methyltransferase, partial [Nonlabens sp.]